MGYGDDPLPFDYHIPGMFDVGPAGPKGPTIGGPWKKGENKFSPWINDFNWKARIACEGKRADHFTRHFNVDLYRTTGAIDWIPNGQTPRSRPGSRASARPESPAVNTLLPQYIEDNRVRRSLSQAMRRAKAIEAGARVSPYPTVQVSNVPDGIQATKRDIILGAAQPLLESNDDLVALDQFLKSRVTGWNTQQRVPQPKKRMMRPKSQAGAARPKAQAGQPPPLDMYSTEVGPPGVLSTYTFDAAKREEKLMRDKAKVPAVGPPMINTMARPQTVPVGMSRRSKSRSEALRQTVYNHFEL